MQPAIKRGPTPYQVPPGGGFRGVTRLVGPQKDQESNSHTRKVSGDDSVDDTDFGDIDEYAGAETP